MNYIIFMCKIITILSFIPISTFSTVQDSLRRGSSLEVERPSDILTSSNRVFSAGFYEVGDNAFCFAIWFDNSLDKTIVWMANRDQPVNGKHSKLKLMKHGNLKLIDADRIDVWSSNTFGGSILQLLDTGNLVLKSESNVTLWQSFNSPANTLLSNQLLTKEVSLISFKSRTNYSSGFYQLYFDSDNVMRLLFDDGMDISDVYWPDISLASWEAGRTNFNNSRVASFDSYGHFESSDGLHFNASDSGIGPQRRLTLDIDGNVRMYSLEDDGQWMVTWQALGQQCNVSGLCGPNSLCKYVPDIGRKCSCLPGHMLKDHRNWMRGCEPEFQVPSNVTQVDFVALPYVFYGGYDMAHFLNYTFEGCQDFCLQSQLCKGFLLKYQHAVYNCFPKAQLFHGFQTLTYSGTLYLKVPKNITATVMSSDQKPEDSKLKCQMPDYQMIQLQRDYDTKDKGGTLKFLVWFASGVGIVEITCVLLVWFFAFRTQIDPKEVTQAYAIVGFKRFTYSELRKATRRFSQEIGKGGYGIVYKGKLQDGRVAAVKKLKDSTHGEAEFLAEANTIGRLNHQHLIGMWGYCAEGKQRLLVFEHMENKSLAENLSSIALDWGKRYEIALGTAKGLAYLHEECMEWVLHCDVKPQNILLDSDYQPKVADFGLSKLMNRAEANHSHFSRIRGTRGYMAPEWITNLPITSKVDVYSYGVVLLEILTGKNPDVGDVVAWVKEMKNEAPTVESWIEKIADPLMQGNYSVDQVQLLTAVALQCVREDRDARPSMSQVVEILQSSCHNIL